MRDEFRFLAHNKHHSSASLRLEREIKIIPIISNALYFLLFCYQKLIDAIILTHIPQVNG